MSLMLYYHPLSSYCHKALIALYENGVACDKTLVNLGDPAERAMLAALWPIAKFPVLQDRDLGLVLPESSIIIEHLDRHYPSTHRLLPDDQDLALQVRLWDRILDNYVHSPMQQIVADRIQGSRGDMSALRATLGVAYGMIDRQLGAREWLVGDRFGLADCAATPALFYASVLQPFPAGCTRLAAYFERLVARPSVRRVLEEAKPWFQYFPFADDLPARFR